jgi:FKBP-type peptidyl-prolyl cis-trans isomerase SlyD
MSKELKVRDGQVVSMEYTLKVDGRVAATSEGQEPMEYVHGAGNILPGLERELTGMGIGERKEVVVAAADGYGEVDERAFMDVPRDQLPKEARMEYGTVLQLKDRTGQWVNARITNVKDRTVRLDFNHPMAGKKLHFAVKVVAMRDATDEEKDHGYVHRPGQQQ